MRFCEVMNMTCMANLTTMLKAIHKKAMEGVWAILKDAAKAGGCRLSGD